MSIRRPDPAEFPPYFGKYISEAAGDDAFVILTAQLDEVPALVRAHADRADHAYAPGKWTVKQVIGHIADCERVFAYRALTFARGDQTPLPGFDENLWAENNPCADRSLEEMLEEFRTVRAATLSLYRGLDAVALDRIGDGNRKPTGVRALAWIVAGHAAHHVTLLRERYFG